MDIQKEREAFEQALVNQKNVSINNLHVCTIFDAEKNKYSPSDVCDPKEDFIIDWINSSWSIWQAAKAQAVPEWKDYTVESPRIDGPYQIFIMNQQLVAKWESPWGFSSIEDGGALNQELITHWSVLGNDPAIEPQEPTND